MQYLGKRLRHELKYYIRPHDYAGLARRLSAVLPRDKHSVNEEGYHIRSLYFDDDYDTALTQKHAGVEKRCKYRIRIYNLSDARINLERKSKFGEWVCKDSAILTREEYDKILEGDVEFLPAFGKPLTQDFYHECKLHGLKPKVIVDYVREAYTHEYGDVRITFDKNLAFNVKDKDIFDPGLITVEAVQEPMIIMEVKYNDFIPQYVQDLLQLSSHNRSAISKYVMCREQNKQHYN
ncbi:polyphosphate polymerase domain-containing protein [Gorillibacterium sp. sgz5001074]|uniref:polyphosphate polymerase domain-containing protein n=1 Tax=Gorillibacterium sp. sgz5001074 TaxID=3446695 RepID=UPI003F67D4F5